MTSAAILLLIVSAALHAGWNFISKQGRPSAGFMLAANTMGCLILVPVVAPHAADYRMFPSWIWAMLLLTGAFQAIYYIALAGAYRAGDMSLAYPLARSSPVIVVMAVTFLLGQADELSVSCVIGILLVVAGCFMVPMKTFRDFRLKNYVTRTCGLALIAAVGTAGYSIVDAESLKSLKGHPGLGAGIAVVTIMYALMEAIAASSMMSIYVMSRKAERVSFIEVLKKERLRAFVTGVCIYITYSLVLFSMSLARNVSYVVGFRQLSIPLGVMLGIVFLKEPVAKPKICGVASLFTGLVLIALG